jgi:hypothetical protein
MTGSVVNMPPHPIGGLVEVLFGFFPPVGMLVGMTGPLATIVFTVILAVQKYVRERIDREKVSTRRRSTRSPNFLPIPSCSSIPFLLDSQNSNSCQPHSYVECDAGGDGNLRGRGVD